jgi:hypothetical protein
LLASTGVAGNCVVRLAFRNVARRFPEWFDDVGKSVIYAHDFTRLPRDSCATIRRGGALKLG